VTPRDATSTAFMRGRSAQTACRRTWALVSRRYPLPRLTQVVLLDPQVALALKYRTQECVFSTAATSSLPHGEPEGIL
jgi:hypothetical protein